MYKKSIYTKEKVVELEMNVKYVKKIHNFTRENRGNTGKTGEELWPVRCVRTFQIFVVSATLSVVAHIISLLILSLFWKVYGCGELQGFPQPLFLIRQYFFRPGKNRK